MIYEYNLSTETIWTSFDFGEVEADSYEEALEKATAEIEANLQKCNDTLKDTGFTVEMNLDQMQIKLKD